MMDERHGGDERGARRESDGWWMSVTIARIGSEGLDNDTYWAGLHNDWLCFELVIVFPYPLWHAGYYEKCSKKSELSIAMDWRKKLYLLYRQCITMQCRRDGGLVFPEKK